MYGHNVIEDVIKYNTYIPQNEMKKQISLIQNAQHFHFDDFSELVDIIKPYIDLDNNLHEQLFLGQLGEQVRLPYELCWFDYSYFFKGQHFKNGLIVKEIQKDILEVYIYEFQDGIWLGGIDVFHVGVNRKINNYKENYTFINESQNIGRSILLKPIRQIDQDRVKQYSVKAISSSITKLNISLLLLNCRNIVTETNYPPDKLQKKRNKQKRQPLFSFKILKLKMPAIRQCSEKGVITNTNRLHLCRGHFKYFTENNPLLGKHTGRYWWQPQIRGNKKMGLVTKEYDISKRQGINP